VSGMPADRPQAPAPELAQIPDTLVCRHRWVAWRYVRRGGKWTKAPIMATTGAAASSTDPETWAPFEDAVAAYDRGGVDGIGSVLGDGVTGVDLDGCVDPTTGGLAPWAEAIVARLGSYTERSPSGRGVHVLVAGTLPPGGRRTGPIELYDAARYFTITGAHVPGTPATVEARQAELMGLHAEVFADRAAPTNGSRPVAPVDLDDVALIAHARTARNAALFSQLWAGAWQGAGYPSQSEADLALASLLAFWCGRDAGRMDRLFRHSGLMRDKWDARRGDGRTYGTATVERAIALCQDVYGNGHRPDDAAPAPVPQPSPTAAAPDLTAATAPIEPPDVDDLPDEEAATAKATENGAGAPHDSPPVDPPDIDLTEDAMALAFTSRHREALLYVHEWGQWLRWDGTRWAPERTLAVFDLARDLTRAIGPTIGNARLAAKIESAATVAAIVTLARTDRAHARVTEDFDADSWLLNTPAGTVELRTGTMRPHQRADGITKVTPVSPSDAAAPLWRRCLETWTRGDTALAAFLQRLAGYCLTGSTKEEILPIVYGPGGNGKTKFIDARCGPS
jgi:putative DNA primase/helicase